MLLFSDTAEYGITWDRMDGCANALIALIALDSQRYGLWICTFVVCCGVLCSAVVWCGVLYCTVLYYTILYPAMLCCNVLF